MSVGIYGNFWVFFCLYEQDLVEGWEDQSPVQRTIQ